MSAAENKNWYYVSPQNERLGPVSIAELSALAGQGKIDPQTLVWNPEQPEWIPAEKIRHLMTAEKPSLDQSSPPAVASPSPLPALELKPRKGSFIFPKILGALIVAVILGSIVSGVLFSLEQSPWFGLAAALFILILSLASAFAAYRKELYKIQSSRLVCNCGGLFSDEATELEIRNITHVKVKLPWLRYKLFRVGDVIVESAGTAKPMVMRMIHDPENIYAEMRERMKSNGYDLTQRELLHEEKPAFIGVLVECLSLFIGAAVFCVFVLAGLLSDIEIPTESIALQAAAGGIFLIIFLAVILRFLDLRRRTYRVFNDIVVYEEGFLTRQNAFIPYENIADSNTKRTLIDQILGLYDVLVSCQGSSSEIKFRRLKNGDHLSDSIDQLVTSASKKPKPSKPTTQENSITKRPARIEPEIIPDAEIRVAEYRIHALRLLIPQMLLLPLVPIWIVAMLKSLILMSSTRYFVRPGSLRHSYKFLRVDDREFSYDKITGVVIKRNLWDKWFNTMTLKFWSIGSGKSLEFAHVHTSQIDLPALMRQVGIPQASEESFNVNARFGLFTWLRAQIGALFAIAILSAAVVVGAVIAKEPLIYLLLIIPALISIIGLIRALLYYSRQHLRFHEHHIEAEQGILSKSNFYVRYKNVKRITATRYPGGGEGSLKIYVAGEEHVYPQQEHPKTRIPMLKQCSFTSGMLPEVAATGRLLDDILSGRTNPSPSATPAAPSEILVESTRSLGNALTALLLTSILIFPLIVFLPITIPAIIIRVKRWRYRIEGFRIVESHGVLFKKETSVLLDRVDSLQQSQRMLNKIFRNGKVTIMTAGSSKPDLAIIDSPDYLRIYEEIRKHSEP